MRNQREWPIRVLFLSIQAQDFIEERSPTEAIEEQNQIPEHSSSGLH